MKIKISDNCCEIEAKNELEVLSGLSMLVKALKMAGVSKERINHSVNVGFMNKKEVKEDTKKHLESILRKLGLED